MSDFMDNYKERLINNQDMLLSELNITTNLKDMKNSFDKLFLHLDVLNELRASIFAKDNNVKHLTKKDKIRIRDCYYILLENLNHFGAIISEQCDDEGFDFEYAEDYKNFAESNSNIIVIDDV